jgi:hypothetical protein
MTSTARPLFFAVLWTILHRAHCELGFEGHDLSNFQGKHACNAKVFMGKPTTVAEVVDVVAAFPR